MILSEYINIKLNSHNINRYRELGYECNQEYLKIKILHLPKGSHYRVDVKCDICENIKNITYYRYIENIENGGIYCCSHKCATIKSRNTKLKKYGNENYNNPNKYKKTCIDKYGVENYFSTDNFKMSQNQILDKDLESWKLYKRKSRNVFRKIRDMVIDKWNGYDYYDNEYIKDNLNLNFYDKNYPTIDHKISVYYGFINNIDVNIINDFNNLVVTKRGNNAVKGKYNHR